jgi:hypothetical protein
MSEQERMKEDKELIDAADWFLACLKDINRGLPCRGLPEAKGAYVHARKVILRRNEKKAVRGAWGLFREPS